MRGAKRLSVRGALGAGVFPLCMLGVFGVMLSGLLGITSLGTVSGSHTLYLTGTDASLVVPGLPVRAAGQKVGEVTAVTLSRRWQPRLTLSLADTAWPLPADTTFRIRLGGTIAYQNRYIELDKGDAGREIADGATLSASHLTPIVAFDSVLDTFNPSTRTALARTLDTTATAFGRAGRPLAATLTAAPTALTQAQGVLQDLNSSQPTLADLLVSADHVVHAIRDSQPGVGALLSGSATTLSAIADQADNLKTSLGEAPATLLAAQRTLSHAGRTLISLHELTAALAPGIGELRRTVLPLDGLLRVLVSVAPRAIATLSTATATAPSINRLLANVTTLMPRVTSISRQAAAQLDCVRPYSPEIAGFLSTWAGGGWAGSDGKDTYLRALVGTYPFTNLENETTAQLLTTRTSIKMVFPQPPGYAVDQPWYQPQCGITAASYDPADDPETRTFGIATSTLVGTANGSAGTAPAGTSPPGPIAPGYPAPKGTG